MGAAGSHLLRLGPALWKFVLRQRRTIVRLYLLAYLALRLSLWHTATASVSTAARAGRGGEHTRALIGGGF